MRFRSRGRTIGLFVEADARSLVFCPPGESPVLKDLITGGIQMLPSAC